MACCYSWYSYFSLVRVPKLEACCRNGNCFFSDRLFRDVERHHGYSGDYFCCDTPMHQFWNTLRYLDGAIRAGTVSDYPCFRCYADDTKFCLFDPGGNAFGNWQSAWVNCCLHLCYSTSCKIN